MLCWRTVPPAKLLLTLISKRTPAANRLVIANQAVTRQPFLVSRSIRCDSTRTGLPQAELWLH